MGYVRLEEIVQGKDTLNKNQSVTFWRWRHGLLFFIHWFIRLVFLFLLYHSGRIAIPHYHMFLLSQVMHLVLFKSLQRQGEMSISGDIRVVLWWSRDGNHCLSFLKRADQPFFCNGFVAIYFWPIFVRQFRKVFLLVLQQCCNDCVIISGRWKHFEISGCEIDLADGAQCKYKC